MAATSSAWSAARPVGCSVSPAEPAGYTIRQPLGERVPDAVARLVEQRLAAGRRDRPLQRVDQPVANVAVARAQGDAVQAFRRDPVDGLEHDLDPRPRRGLARDGQPVGLDHRRRGHVNSRQTAPSATARTTPMIG